MTIILILTLALAAGVFIQSRWALLFPLAFGAAVALARPPPDTPLTTRPFRSLWSCPRSSWSEAQGLRSRGRAQVL